MKFFISLFFVFSFFLFAFAPKKLQSTYLLSESERKLVIDNDLIAFINKQAAIDVPEQIVFFADSIFVTEPVIFNNLDIVLYTNYFEGRKKLTIVPSALGQNGKNVVLFAKKINEVEINLSGNTGNIGAKGGNGKNGNKMNMDEDDHISLGTRGKAGLKGESGGDGGNLIIHSLNSNYNSRFISKGGIGGAGGEGGQGGLTFFQPITKIIFPGKPNEKKIYGATQSRNEPKGNVGPVGEIGKDGTITKNILTESKFDESVSKFYIEDWKNITKNGWRIVFKNKQPWFINE